MWYLIIDVSVNKKPVAAVVLNERVKVLKERAYEVSCVHTETCQKSYNISK